MKDENTKIIDLTDLKDNTLSRVHAVLLFSPAWRILDTNTNKNCCITSLLSPRNNIYSSLNQSTEVIPSYILHLNDSENYHIPQSIL